MSTLAPPLGLPYGAVPVPTGPRVWRLPGWDGQNNAQRLSVLSKIARESAADPRLRRLAVQVFRSAGVEPRDYTGQAAALLAFVQKHVYFVNEQDEVLQAPSYTLSLGPDGSVGQDAHGDCDDQAVTLAALARSVHLPVRFVTSGRLAGRKIRWIEGVGSSPTGAQWSHVYVQIGNHPFRPTSWAFADPTVKGAALGWDCISDGQSDPQLGDPGDERVSGLTWRGAFQLIAVGVATNLIIKHLSRWV